MAHVSKLKLQEALNKSINASAQHKKSLKAAYADLVDSTAHKTIPHPDISLLTTSGSGVVTMEVIQPANSVITEIMVLCTADTSAPAAQQVGLRIGTTTGGQEILDRSGDDAMTSASFGNAITVIKKGQGVSTHSKFATQFSGSTLTLEPQTATTTPLLATAERSIYVQVSASAASAVNGRFDTNTGAFKPIVHFELL